MKKPLFLLAASSLLALAAAFYRSSHRLPEKLCFFFWNVKNAHEGIGDILSF